MLPYTTFNSARAPYFKNDFGIHYDPRLVRSEALAMGTTTLGASEEA